MSREIFSQKKTYIKKSWTFGTVLSTCLISLDLVFTVSYWISIINLSSCHNQIYCIYLHDLYFLFHDAMHNFAFYLEGILKFMFCFSWFALRVTLQLWVREKQVVSISTNQNLATFSSDHSKFIIENYQAWHLQVNAMGATVSRSDFEWAEHLQPHPTRRKEILGKIVLFKWLNAVDTVIASYLASYLVCVLF